MEQLALELRITRLVISGAIPLPCSLMAAVEFLGTHDTSSLPLSGTDEPCDGRNYWSTVGANLSLNPSPVMKDGGTKLRPSSDGSLLIRT